MHTFERQAEDTNKAKKRIKNVKPKGSGIA